MPFNRKDHHNFGEIRPRFKLLTALSPDEIFSRLKNFVAQDDSVEGKKILDHFFLDIPSAYRHFWSPELRVTTDTDDSYPDKIILRVMVGPPTNVWLIFVFSYAVLGLTSLFGGMYGLVQWNMGNESLWVYCLPVSLGLTLFVWMIAKTGQKIARDETLHLVSVLYHALGHDNAKRIES